MYTADEETTVTLVCLSNDPFVNAGVAALAAALSDTVSVMIDQLLCATETIPGTVADLLADLDNACEECKLVFDQRLREITDHPDDYV